MDIILMAGLWLPRSIWSPVGERLADSGHRVTALALPGVDDGRASATLDDQLAAAVDAVDGADHPLVVGHSAAGALAWLVADRRPEAIAGVVLIGGFPIPDGGEYAAFFDLVDGVMPFPGWGPFDGPDSADLTAEQRERIAAESIPVAGGVATGVVRLHDERRFGVPTFVVCPEFSPDDARSWIDAGQLPELEPVERRSLIDIDSGHWPMVSRPGALAEIIDAIARDLAAER